MKRAICIIMSITMIVMTFSGCGSSLPSANSDKLKIVTTIFPQYDWVRKIIGENAEHVELTLLLDNGVDLHSYQPTTDDIITISNCDMLIYVGGTSDAWIENALKTASNQDMVVIKLLDVLGSAVKDEEIKEGMEHEHDEHAHEDDEDHEHEGDENHEHENEGDEREEEVDEHVWLSIRNAQMACAYIADQLCKLEPENAEVYEKNVLAYLSWLGVLNGEYENVIDAAATKTLLFGGRFPFRYLTDDYGLDYYAAFAGCSAETEASFETIVFLAEKVDELGLEHVMITDEPDRSIAQTIIESTKDKNQGILMLNSMQSVTASDVSSGVTYHSIMTHNLDVLVEALGVKVN